MSQSVPYYGHLGERGGTWVAQVGGDLEEQLGLVWAMDPAFTGAVGRLGHPDSASIYYQGAGAM